MNIYSRYKAGVQTVQESRKASLVEGILTHTQKGGLR